MGALRKYHADHRRHVHRSAGWPSPACPRSRASGRRTRSSPTRLRQELRRCGSSASIAALLTAFYMTRQVVPGLLRRGPLGRERRGRAGDSGPRRRRRSDASSRPAAPTTPTTPTARCWSTTSSTPSPAPRTSRPGSMTRAARRAGVLRRRRRRAQPALHRATWSSSTAGSSRSIGASTRPTSTDEHRSSWSWSSPSPRSSPSSASASPYRGLPAAQGRPAGRSSCRSWPTAGTSTTASPRSWAARAAGVFERVAVFDQVVIDGAVNGVGTLARGGGRPAAQRPDRLRAQLRARHRRRCGPAHRLRPDAGVLHMTAAILASDGATFGFPILPALVLVPLLGAAADRRAAPVAGPRSPGRSAIAHRRHRRASAHRTCWSTFQTERRRASSSWSTRPGSPTLGISLHLGRRRHLAVPGRAHRAPVPDRLLAAKPAPRRQGRTTPGSLVLEAGCIGRVPRARPVPVLRLLRDRARPDVLPHRRVGPRPAGLRRDQVLPLHDVRLGVHARVGIVALACPATSGRRRHASPSTSPSHRQRPGLATNTGRWLFLGFAIAFAVKVPLFPFHTWLPDAHTEAPTAGSVDPGRRHAEARHLRLPALRPRPVPRGVASGFAPLICRPSAVIGIIYGAVVAAMQKDLKRLVAYSSVAHLGFVVLGIFALTTQGVEGAVLQMVNHGISTGALFLLRRHASTSAATPARSPSSRACRSRRRSSPASSPS